MYVNSTIPPHAVVLLLSFYAPVKENRPFNDKVISLPKEGFLTNTGLRLLGKFN